VDAVLPGVTRERPRERRSERPSTVGKEGGVRFRPKKSS